MFDHPFLHFIDRVYGFIIKIGSNLHSLFLLYLRLVWGHQFFLSGIGKLDHMDQTIQFFHSLGIPLPAFHSYVVAYTETIGGILLIIGFATRLASIPLIITMIVALATAHSHIVTSFQFVTAPTLLAKEDPYPFLVAVLALFIFGPGRVSIDAWIKRWADKQPKY